MCVCVCVCRKIQCTKMFCCVIVYLAQNVSAAVIYKKSGPISSIFFLLYFACMVFGKFSFLIFFYLACNFTVKVIPCLESQ